MPSLDHITGRRRASSLWFSMNNVERHALTMGMYSYYVNGDISSFKNWFYVATKLRLANLDDPLDTTGFLLVALLSDNNDVILEAANAKRESLTQSPGGFLSEISVKMAQQAIVGDDSQLSQSIEMFNKFKDEKKLNLFSDFYSRLIEKDREGLEKIVQESSKVRSKEILFEKSFSHIGTLQAKLCWRRNIEIEVESPWVPMQLMPVRPLLTYDNVYDFLKPGWQRPKYGFLSALKRLF